MKICKLLNFKHYLHGKTALFSLLFLSLQLFISGEILAQSSPTIAPGCANADWLWSQIPVWSGGERPSSQYGFKGLQGETGRRLLLYKDFYILTLEFFGPKPEADVSCLMESGELAEAYNAITKRYSALPVSLGAIDRQWLEERFQPSTAASK